MIAFVLLAVFWSVLVAAAVVLVVAAVRTHRSEVGQLCAILFAGVALALIPATISLLDHAKKLDDKTETRNK